MKTTNTIKNAKFYVTAQINELQAHTYVDLSNDPYVKSAVEIQGVIDCLNNLKDEVDPNTDYNVMYCACLILQRLVTNLFLDCVAPTATVSWDGFDEVRKDMLRRLKSAETCYYTEEEVEREFAVIKEKRESTKDATLFVKDVCGALINFLLAKHPFTIHCTIQ